MAVDSMASRGPPEAGTVAKATLSIPDAKIMALLINGGLTEDQIAGFTSPQDLAKEIVDMVEISTKENGSLSISLE